jgi:hypothetical protein
MSYDILYRKATSDHFKLVNERIAAYQEARLMIGQLAKPIALL